MTAPSPTLRIGGACAFWGDSDAGVSQLVRGTAVDVLVFDYLAELTMSILARARSKAPQAGYATDFIGALVPVLGEIASRKIKVLSNAGGMNPKACAAALRKAAAEAGVTLSIAVVEGDDLLAAKADIAGADVRELFSGKPLPATLTSVNAYLGAAPVVAALARGADVVITGRCVDSALSLAALIHHFGWSMDDYDRLAAGSLVGHILECSTQTTGGLYTDWWQVPGWENMGFPVAECSADGSFVLTKPPGTGGLILPTVAAEQMLYEIGDPANYLLPDVSCDFTSVTIEQDGENRVRLSGAKGGAPTDTYKVSATWLDGYRLSTTLTIVGDKAVAKAERVCDAILKRARALMGEAGHADFSETMVEILGSERPSYGLRARQGESREVVVRIAARHADARALEVLAREMAPFGVSGAPGTTGFAGRAKPQAVFRLFSFLWPKNRVAITVSVDESTQVMQVPSGTTGAFARAAGARHALEASPAHGRVTVPLSAIAVARSGDKGDIANVAIIARQPNYVGVIAEQLTPEVVARHFSHLVRGKVTRYDVPGVNAFNYVLEQALAGGGAASLRNDPLGKTFGQILLGYSVEIPSAWLPEIDPALLESSS